MLSQQMKGGQFLENPEKKLVMESLKNTNFGTSPGKSLKSLNILFVSVQVQVSLDASLPSEQENDEYHDKYLLPLYCNFYFMVDLHHSVLIISSFCSSQSNSS